MNEPKIRIIRFTETVRELPKGGWQSKHTGRTYKSASGVLAAFKRNDQQVTRDIPNTAVVRTINWEPVSWAGTQVVKILSQP